MPFKVENYCSDGCPMYAIVVKSITANRGYPVEVGPDSFSVDRWKVMEAEEACAKHGIELDGEPKWWLASYWG